MGSGGASRSYEGDTREVDELEDIARREVEEERQPRKRAFLSFRSEDLDKVNLFRGQARNSTSNLDFIDYSLKTPFDSEDADYIRQGIRSRIKNSSVTIVLIGENAHQSEWVNWEVRESINQGNDVIGVKIERDKDVKIPEAIEEHDVEVMEWNQEEINERLREV
ncbi:MAG: TIR domain-containing protein [Thermoplasmatota archaeon]